MVQIPLQQPAQVAPSLTALEQFVCPQCGGLVSVPRRVDRFSCSWCGSLLDPGSGLRFYRRAEQVRITREQAAERFRAWLASPELPRHAESEAAFSVGELRLFPFLRLKGRGADRFLPMAELPTADVLDLTAVPAALEETDADEGAGANPGEGAGADPGGGEAPAGNGGGPPRGAIEASPDLLAKALHEAAGQGSSEAILEHRGFYPVSYTYRDDTFTAIVDVSGGRVWAGRRPALLRSQRETPVSLGVAALLMLEALLIPGLWPAAIAILLTVVVLFVALRPWLRHG